MGSKGQPDRERLEKEGWVKQFVANEPRLSEAVDLYKDLGLTCTSSLSRRTGVRHLCRDGGVPREGECRVCFEGFEDQYKIIFTRRRKDSKPSED